MRKEFDTISEITTRQITAEDWESFRDYHTASLNRAHFSGFFEERDAQEPQTYADFFDQFFSEPNAFIGLFDGEKMIGQAGVFFDEKDGQRTAMFQGIEIDDHYRGRSLSKSLHESRMQYLRDMGYDGPILTSIRPDNEASLRAAHKAGFRETGAAFSDKLILQHPGVTHEG